MWHDAIRYALLRVFYPCLMIFGTIGNILCLKILLRKRFRRQSTCQYLSILAVIDILFIYLRSARHFYQQFYKIDPRNTSLWMCRTLIFISSTLSHIASWILVVVSFDRYLIVKNRLSYRNAGWRVIKSTCCLICIVCLVNSHYFYILGINKKFRLPLHPFDKNHSNETYHIIIRFVCIARTEFDVFFRYYIPIFDLLFVAIIPCLLMIFTNFGIIRTTMRSSMLCQSTRKQKRNNRLTIMLLSVIIAFIFLTCPSVIYICLNRLLQPTAFSDKKLVLRDLFELLWYTKHSLNFLLYTLSGQDFRREFRKLISCSKRSTANNSSFRSRRQRDDDNWASMDSSMSTYHVQAVRTHLHKTKRKQHLYTTDPFLLSNGRLVFDDGDSSIVDGAFLTPNN